ncbi:MAG TPA: hypothetical protein VNU71_14715 [Burkholderiaceae bacterium]|nr:hypothetical protein [Burkholderiaceae bacterium]
MKTAAQYIADAKTKLGDSRMSDREFGENLGQFHDGGFSQQDVSRAKRGPMTDPMAVAIAKALRIEPGEVLWVARTEREKDPAVRKHLEVWGLKVGKILASVPAKALGALCALAVALGMFLPQRDALAGVGGAGRFRP